MKRLILITLILSSVLCSLYAREYSYLDPPTISIMDFDVNMESFQYVTRDDVVQEDQSYYGQLINQTLLTILIQKNSANDTFIINEESYGKNLDGFFANDKQFDQATYFPTLFKIYDKKYVESALGNNSYTVNDLYSKNQEAFSYADLDFVVLGNVYRQGDNIALNVRVLSTNRGEELYSYIGSIKSDMSNLNSVCNAIAGNIITDVLKNYCSQFIIKVQEEEDKTENRMVPVDEGKLAVYFCQSRQEYDNSNDVISYNDTYKKEVQPNEYYWLLPGDYVFTVYSQQNQTVDEIEVTIDPREIELVEITAENFEVETGSLTIGGIFPTDGFDFSIKEKAKDVKYVWEINQGGNKNTNEVKFVFNDGEISDLEYLIEGSYYYDNDNLNPSEDDKKPKISYNAFSNEIKVRGLNLSEYDIEVTPLAESIQRRGVTGIVYISSREIETSDTVTVDLLDEQDVTINMSDFDIKEFEEGEAFQQTRLTFLFDKAFSDEVIQLYVTNQESTGFIRIRNIEKLIIEDEYSEEDWELLAGQSFQIMMFREGMTPYQRSIDFEDIVASKDEIIILDLSNDSGAIELGSQTNISGTTLFGGLLRGN